MLGLLGSVPLAAGFTWTDAEASEAAQAAQAARRAPAAGPKAAGFKPKFFTAREYAMVRVLVDLIIPKDARSGSATDAGVPDYIDYQMSVAETDDASRVAMHGGLAWLNTESRARFRKSYASLSADQRRQILDDIAWPDRAKPEFSHGTAFFSRFRDLVGAGFFSSAVGWRDLRYEGNVFNPNWQGCPESAMKKLGVSHALMDTRIKPDQPTG